MRHETSRDTRATGATAAAGDRAGEGRADAVGGGAPVLGLDEFGVPLVAGVRARGGAGSAPQAHPRTPIAIVAGPESEAGHAAGPRAVVGRVPHRSLDVAPSGRADPPAVWRSLSSGARVESPDRPGLELSEARAAGCRAERTGHRPVEVECVAPDKKTPPAGAPTSCSSMRAASCSSPLSGGPGRPAGRRRICAIGIATIASRSVVGWRCRLDGARSRSISTAAPPNLTGLDIETFLRHLLRHLRGPVDLLWDRGPIHRRGNFQALPRAPSPAARPLLPRLRARTQPRRVGLGPNRPRPREWRPERSRRTPPLSSHRGSPPSSLARSPVVLPLRLGVAVDTVTYSIAYAKLNSRPNSLSFRWRKRAVSRRRRDQVGLDDLHLAREYAVSSGGALPRAG